MIQQYLDPFKKRLPKNVKRALRTAVSVVSERVSPKPSHSSTAFPIPFWYERNLWEPAVQVALKDLCKPGQTVFDVGANAGALSMLMSRLVGPKGIVCAFEASPRIVDKTNYNLRVNNCSNVFLVHRAVFEESDHVLDLFPGSHLNDSIVNVTDGAGDPFKVRTISLDDFCSHFDLQPSLIKFDIEGAEYKAILGAKGILSKLHPHLILENPGAECAKFLFGIGYKCVDLANYRNISDPNDPSMHEQITNVLFYFEERAKEVRFVNGPSFERVETIDGAEFAHVATTNFSPSGFVRLGPGRYLFDFDFSSRREDNDVMVGVESRREPLARYHANAKFLSMHYRTLLVDLDCETEIRPFFQFLSGTSDPSLSVREVRISRLLLRPISAPGLL